MKKFDSSKRFENWILERTKQFLKELEEEIHKKG